MDEFVLPRQASRPSAFAPYDVENDFCPAEFRALFPPAERTIPISDFETILSKLSKKLTLDEIKLLFNAHRLTTVNDENESPSVDLEVLAQQSLSKLRLEAGKVRTQVPPDLKSLRLVIRSVDNSQASIRYAWS